jgi:CheY-like chemotaxis protein
MASVTTNLTALMLEDDPLTSDLSAALMNRADISVTSVSDSDAALQHFEQINLVKTSLDVFITDGQHPGLPGLHLIRKIRDFPDKMTMQGGLRLRHVPIVTWSASLLDHSKITAIDPSIVCVDKPSRFEVLLKAIDNAVRNYRDKILGDLHYMGVGVQFTGGRFTLVQCYSLPPEKRFESK